MTLETIERYIAENGIWVLGLLVAVEYLGLPGYPGGFMLPVIGALARLELIGLPMGILIAMTASSITVVAVYFVGLKFSRWAVDKLSVHEKFVRVYEQMRRLTQKYGAASIFVLRLLPMVRTFASIIAGILNMDWRSYCIYSFAGNFVYTLGAVALGYFAFGIFA